MEKLSTRDKDLCTYTGVFGVMLSLTCLIQNFLYSISHWIPTLFGLMYLFILLSFALLTAQRSPAPTLLIISFGLVFIAEILLLRVGIFSLPVLMLVCYTAIIALLTHVNRIHIKLKEKAIFLKREREQWDGKI